MRKSGLSLVFVCLLLVAGWAFAAGGVKTLAVGFFAPEVSTGTDGKPNVPNPEHGAIVLQNSSGDTSFSGFNGSDWVNLSASSSDAVQNGTIHAFLGSAAPTGYILANGASHLRSAYPKLAELFGCVESTTTCAYGAVDTEHFNAPNLSGLFLRSTGSQMLNTGTDTVTYAGASLGQVQFDQFQGHHHAIIGDLGNPGSANGISGSATTGGGYGSPTGAVRGPITDNVSGAARVGNETRPVSFAVTYIIKAR